MLNFLVKFEDYNAFIQIFSEEDVDGEYLVEFTDQYTNNIEYSTKIKNNSWSKVNSDDDKNWLITVTLNDELIFSRKKHDYFNKVFIYFDSCSLGDNIAWIPYVDEYRKKNKCEVIVSTEWSYIFKDSYPNLKFTDTYILWMNDVDKRFALGCIDKFIINRDKFDNKYYFDYRNVPLQFVAALYLDLPLIEIKPNIVVEGERKIKSKYVVVAIQSTLQMKYWNHPNGWSTLFDWLSRQGYKIVLIDKNRNFGVYGYFNEAPKHKDVIDKTGDYTLIERMIDIKYADFFIGVSSGLAWLSWSVGTTVVMISGFTKPWNEFKSNIIRINNTQVCNGCWNNYKIDFQQTNWMSCPKNKDFICTKIIEPRTVIDRIKKLLPDKEK
jgi:autotransporter strand-loop-strand O-heptosyltransferase